MVLKVSHLLSKLRFLVKCSFFEPFLRLIQSTLLNETSYRFLVFFSAPVVVGFLSCTFEAGFCRWRNTRRGDNFEWKLGAGLTPSRYTGPTNDHTFSSTKGNVIPTRHATLCHITLCHVTLFHVTLFHVTLCHVTLCHATLCHVKLYHVMLRHSHHFISFPFITFCALFA